MTAGDASFSIYLSHWFVLSAVGKLLGALQPPAYSAEVVRVLGVAVSVAVGVWIFKVLERPLDLWLRGGAMADQFPWLRYFPRPSIRRSSE